MEGVKSAYGSTRSPIQWLEFDPFPALEEVLRSTPEDFCPFTGACVYEVFKPKIEGDTKRLRRDDAPKDTSYAELVSVLRDRNNRPFYVDLNSVHLTIVTDNLRAELIRSMPTDFEITSALYNGHGHRILTPMPLSDSILNAVHAHMHAAYWTTESVRVLLSSLDPEQVSENTHQYYCIGLLHIAPVAREYYSTIAEQPSHRDNAKRGQEICLAIALGAYPLGTLFKSHRTGTYLAANTGIFLFDGYNRHKGPGHAIPINATLPYIGPRRAFAHFVSTKLTRIEISALQERDGMPKIAPVLINLSACVISSV